MCLKGLMVKLSSIHFVCVNPVVRGIRLAEEMHLRLDQELQSIFYSRYINIPTFLYTCTIWKKLERKGSTLIHFINPDLVPFRFGIAHIVYSILLRLFIYFDNIIVMHSLYLEEGFLHLQNAVSLAIIEAMANKTIDIKVSVEVSVVFSNSNTCIHVHVLSQLSSYLMVIF